MSRWKAFRAHYHYARAYMAVPYISFHTQTHTQQREDYPQLTREVTELMPAVTVSCWLSSREQPMNIKQQSLVTERLKAQKTKC